MAIRENAFSRERCLEAVLLIASELDRATVADVLVVRYLADKLHLSEFGFFPAGNTYVALAEGPAEAGTLRLLSEAWQDMNASAADRRFLSLLKGSLLVEPPGGRDRVKALRQPDLTFISDSESHSIRAAVARYEDVSIEQRRSIARDDAWAGALRMVASATDTPPISIASIARTLRNSEEVLAYLHS